MRDGVKRIDIMEEENWEIKEWGRISEGMVEGRKVEIVEGDMVKSIKAVFGLMGSDGIEWNEVG